MIPNSKNRLLLEQLLQVREYLVSQEKTHAKAIAAVHPHYRGSAMNLVHYLALRTFNLRDVQAELSQRGLSSIGHSERYTLANIDNILHLLHLMVGDTFDGETPPAEHQATFRRSTDWLKENTQRLFGAGKHSFHTRTMVTMPSEAANDYGLIRKLLESGMEIARINCSHDDEATWGKMIKNLRHAAAELNTHCLVYMDLAGPKLRTGPVKIRESKKKKKPINYLTLFRGDVLHLHREPILGKDAKYDEHGQMLRPARIGVTLPAIFEHLDKGQMVWFDDGSIGARVIDKGEVYAALEIVQADINGSKLKAEKGINLPETQLDLPALTDEDLAALPFIAREADMVGYSFVRYPSDVAALQRRLEKLGRPDLGIVVKVETRLAFENLPDLLLTAMKSPTVGVMIARGDLAVEIGWDRISEVQEEILWICEAAHIPIIWATQVLERLAKKGVASRAEITDAAMAARSECVMLNKGPYIVEALTTLNDILRRMQHHAHKKQGTLRALQVAQRFLNQPVDAGSQEGG